MSGSRFFDKAKTEGAITPKQPKPELRRTKTMEQFLAGRKEEEAEREYNKLKGKMLVWEETQELQRMIPQAELRARTQLLGDLLRGQKKQPEVEAPDEPDFSAAAAAKP